MKVGVERRLRKVGWGLEGDDGKLGDRHEWGRRRLRFILNLTLN